MPLLPVHEYDMDRATSRLELVRINPTRSYVIKTDTGMGIYTWQAGSWFDLGGNEIQDPKKTVPEQFLKDIESNPVTITNAGPAVTSACRVCGEKMNTSELETHYLGHVHEAMAQAGSEKKSDKNTHARV